METTVNTIGYLNFLVLSPDILRGHVNGPSEKYGHPSQQEDTKEVDAKKESNLMVDSPPKTRCPDLPRDFRTIHKRKRAGSSPTFTASRSPRSPSRSPARRALARTPALTHTGCARRTRGDRVHCRVLALLRVTRQITRCIRSRGSGALQCPRRPLNHSDRLRTRFQTAPPQSRHRPKRDQTRDWRYVARWAGSRASG